MKSLFVAGVVLGVMLALSVARTYPWVHHPRQISRTTVLYNGGRVEDFMIRYPVDLIVGAGTAEMGLRAKGFPAGVELPGGIADERLLVEHFKLRDDQGDVIGLAARHSSVIEGEAAIAWTLTIPSRGTMYLVGAAEPGQMQSELAAAGRIDGQTWRGAIALNMGFDRARSGGIAGGSHEFANLTGMYVENWSISGVSQAGDVRALIKLHTVAENNE